MYQKYTAIGRLTNSPELNYTNKSNIAVCSFTLAVNKPYGDKQADFIKCTAWKKTAEIINKYVSKGSLIFIEGKLQNKSYVDPKTKENRFVTEVVCDSVVFLDTKNNKIDTTKTTETTESTNNKNNNEEEDDKPF